MTKIEWTKRPGTVGVSWNPLRARNKKTGGVGHFCEKVSAGCKNCYAETFQKRFNNPVRYAAQDADQVEVFLDEKTLLEPLKWRKRRTVFVCSQTDLFLRHYTDEMICKVFAVMALQKPDTFIVLTKRPERANAFLRSEETQEKIGKIMRQIYPRATCYECPDQDGIWPLSNVWLGVSIEDQATADERIPILLRTPTELRFISAEPLLGPVNLKLYELEPSPSTGRPFWRHNSDALHPCDFTCSGGHAIDGGIDWVIVGGESGSKANPMHPDWAKDLRDQCNADGIPFFFKQHGKWLHQSQDPEEKWDWFDADDRCILHHWEDGTASIPLNKQKSGRALYGVEHNAWPGDAA